MDKKYPAHFFEYFKDLSANKLEEKKKAWKNVRSSFLFLMPDEAFNELEALSDTLPVAIQNILKNFTENLKATAITGSLPYAMVVASVRKRRYQQLFLAERIRLMELDADAEGEAKHERQASRIAEKKLRKEFTSMAPSGNFWVLNEIIEELRSSLQHTDFHAASADLLRQTLVMTWSTFETFLGDAIICHINLHPKMAANLLLSDSTKKHFPVKGISIEALAERSFDVSNDMGSILFSDGQLESLPKIKDILSVLAPNNEDLHSVFGSKEMWLLWQRRHVIVHKRSIIDKSYVAKTGEHQPLGSKLVISSKTTDESLLLVAEATLKFLKALYLPN